MTDSFTSCEYCWTSSSERQLVRELTCEVGCAHCVVNCAQTAICALLMTTSVIRRGWQCVIHHFHGSHALRLYSTTLSSRLIFNLIISFLSPLLHSVPGSEVGSTRIRCTMDKYCSLEFEISTSNNKRTQAGLECRESSAEEGLSKLEYLDRCQRLFVWGDATPINLQENGNVHAPDLLNSRYLPGYHTTRFQRKPAYVRARLVNVKPDEEVKRILLEWPILHSVKKNMDRWNFFSVKSRYWLYFYSLFSPSLSVCLTVVVSDGEISEHFRIYWIPWSISLYQGLTLETIKLPVALKNLMNGLRNIFNSLFHQVTMMAWKAKSSLHLSCDLWGKLYGEDAHTSNLNLFCLIQTF